MDVKAIQQRLEQFSRERDWEQFHSPKNLAMALAGEAGELVEIFQWLTEAESRSKSDAARLEAASQELADITIYALRLADKLGIDLEAAVQRKMEVNAAKYPVALARGNATKYSRRAKK